MGVFISLEAKLLDGSMEDDLSLHKAPDAEHVQRSLGRHIRELRSQQGWSQEEFAQVCGLHRTYMGHVERGDKNVSLSTVLKVANALGVRLSGLFGRVEGRTASGKASEATLARKRNPAAVGATGGLYVKRLLDELQAQRQALRRVVRDLTKLLVSRT
jgi:transcriptional regulator with XRE-family HTH domain